MSDEQLFKPIIPEKIKISDVAFINILLIFLIMTNTVLKKLQINYIKIQIINLQLFI